MWAYCTKTCTPLITPNTFYEVVFFEDSRIIIKCDDPDITMEVLFGGYFKHCWRIVLKPRIRRMGVIG